MTHRHLITDSETAADFILAGKAIFTLANTATGNHATYRVESMKGADDTFSVALFVGTENTVRSAYSVIGEIREGVFTCTLKGQIEAIQNLREAAEDEANNGESWLVNFCSNLLSCLKSGRTITDRQMICLQRNLRKRGINIDSLSPADPKVRGFGWVKARTDAGKAFPEGVEFWTEGRCCTCGRRLTNPDSIHDLEGPVCKGRRGRTLTGIVITPEHEDA